MQFLRKTEPAALPVSLQEAKDQCNVDGNEFDNALNMFIKAAVRHLDGYNGILGFAIMEQQWELTLDDFTQQQIELPLGPLKQVDSVTYIADGSTTFSTIASSAYVIRPGNYRTTVENLTGWPTPSMVPSAVKVLFTVGYPNAAAVPEDIKFLVLALVAHWMENRGAVVMERVNADVVPLHFRALANSVRRVGV